MNLSDIVYSNNNKPYNFNIQKLKHRYIKQGTNDISNSSGTLNDLNFIYKQNILNESEKFKDSNVFNKLHNNRKNISNLLSIINMPRDAKDKVNNLYNLAQNINLDKPLDELFHDMNKATKAIKSIFKGLF